MHFKLALCLVIAIALHSTTAQYETVSEESLVACKMEKLEQHIIEKVQALLEHFTSYAREEKSREQKEVIERLDSQAESVKTLRSITSDILAGQLEIQKEWTNVKNDLHRLKSDGDQEKAKLNKVHSLLNSTYVQNVQVIDKIAAQTTNAQLMAESVRNLAIIANNLLVGHLEIQNKLPDVTNGSIEQANQSSSDVITTSCATLNHNTTGTYYIQPVEAAEPFLVRCDFEDNFKLGGGWTVFQQRYDGSVDFYRNWTMYRDGFGDVNAEHWLGLEKLHLMTKSGKHELLIILEDFDGYTAYAHYKDFKISSEYEKYQLTVGNYSGTAGDSLAWHNGDKFSTFDPTTKTTTCAEKYRAGWWFAGCYSNFSLLNGVYHRKGVHVTDDLDGFRWNDWKGPFYSLKSSKMMLRHRPG